MFSDLGAKDFDQDSAKSRQNVLDVLKRLGIETLWIENNSGCKGVCDRTRTLVASTEQPVGCAKGTCLDEALPRLLERELPSLQSDAVVVLHQQGSHGPAYYKRYPPPGVFQPTCDTNQIQTCARSALLNTYDNTIDYTSQILAMTLDVAASRRNAADYMVLYVSDHGESLGEAGLYLHGLPKVLAPKQQVQIPMMLWLSASAEKRLRTSRSCLSKVVQKPLSHDNLFHTMLGIYNVRSAAYNPSLDIFEMARSNQCMSERA
jgi:lipid A ethanolaminephosphotransferase